MSLDTEKKVKPIPNAHRSFGCQAGLNGSGAFCSFVFLKILFASPLILPSFSGTAKNHLTTTKMLQMWRKKGEKTINKKIKTKSVYTIVFCNGTVDVVKTFTKYFLECPFNQCSINKQT